MGYFTVLPGNNPEDNDMLLYVENPEDDHAVRKSSIPRRPAGDAGENPAELSDIQIIASTETTSRIPEVVNNVENDADNAELSVIEINASTSFPSVNDVTISPNNSSARYKCRKCNQLKRGHDCPFKNSTTDTTDDVLKESVGGPRSASNRENLSRLAKRVDGDETSDSDWVAPNRIGKRKSASTSDEREENSPPKKVRKVYECRNCHVPKKGHVCPKKNLD